MPNIVIEMTPYVCIRHDRKIGVAYAAALRQAQLHQIRTVYYHQPHHVLQIRSERHVKVINLISGLFQPNIGRHQIENCIHYTVRLLSS